MGEVIGKMDNDNYHSRLGHVIILKMHYCHENGW